MVLCCVFFCYAMCVFLWKSRDNHYSLSYKSCGACRWSILCTAHKNKYNDLSLQDLRIPVKTWVRSESTRQPVLTQEVYQVHVLLESFWLDNIISETSKRRAEDTLSDSVVVLVNLPHCRSSTSQTASPLSLKCFLHVKTTCIDTNLFTSLPFHDRKIGKSVVLPLLSVVHYNNKKVQARQPGYSAVSQLVKRQFCPFCSLITCSVV